MTRILMAILILSAVACKDEAPPKVHKRWSGGGAIAPTITPLPAEGRDVDDSAKLTREAEEVDSRLANLDSKLESLDRQLAARQEQVARLTDPQPTEECPRLKKISNLPKCAAQAFRATGGTCEIPSAVFAFGDDEIKDLTLYCLKLEADDLQAKTTPTQECPAFKSVTKYPRCPTLAWKETNGTCKMPDWVTVRGADDPLVDMTAWCALLESRVRKYTP